MTGAWRMIVAGVLAGAALGVVEAILLGTDGELGSIVLPVLARYAWAGAGVGVFGALAVGLVGRRPVPWRRVVIAGGIAAGTLAVLYLKNQFKRDPGGPAGAGMVATTATVLAALALAVVFPERSHRGSISRGLALMLAAAGLAIVDPRSARGTYPSLDLMLLGWGISTAAFGIAALLTTTGPRTGIATTILAIAALGAIRLSEDPARMSELVLSSNRCDLLDRTLVAIGVREPRPLDDPRDVVDSAAIMDPPVPLAQSRDRWRAMRKGKKPLSLVWVTLDAVRSDATGLNGGRHTPRLDALAAVGFGFPATWSQAPATGFSVESFTTGRYTSRTAVAFGWRAGRASVQFPSIAEHLGKRGFRTGFITGLHQNKFDDPENKTFSRLPNGFHELVTSPSDVDANRTADQALEWIDKNRAGRFFAWVHYFDPHAPYVPRDGLAAGAEPRRLWEGEVTYADRALGKVLDGLKERGLEDEVVVVVHSDHAEAFGEHNRFFHASSYYDTQIHIPLVIRVPGMKPARIDRPTSNVDLFPTLVDLLQVEAPDYLQGHSLLPVMLDPRLEWPKFMLAETTILEDDGRWPDDRLRTISDGRWKLIEFLSGNARLLFDRVQDPLETTNLAEERKDVVRRLLGWLDAVDQRLDAADARYQATTVKLSITELRKQLNSRDAHTRLTAFQRLMFGGRPDALGQLEDELEQLRPQAAHSLLIVLDHYLMADTEGLGVEIPLPDQPSPMRFRLLERYARSPRFWDLPMPEISDSITTPEAVAVAEARAARGLPEPLTAMKQVEPASRELWNFFAPILARGRDPAGAQIIIAQTQRNDAKEAWIVRGLRALAAADPIAFLKVVVHIWPSDVRRVSPARLEAIADMAIGIEHPHAWLGLLALHSTPEASAAAPRLEAALLKRSPALTRERVVQLSRRWGRARFLEGRLDAVAALEATLALVPKNTDLPTDQIRNELTRARITRPTHIPESLVVQRVTGIASGIDQLVAGPPRVHLKWSGKSRLPLGPERVPFLGIVWRQGDRQQQAGILGLPRIALPAGGEETFVIPLDYPRGTGTWRLAVTLEDTILPMASPAPTYSVPKVSKWEGPALARVCTAWPLPVRLLPDGALFEAWEDGDRGFALPALELPKGKVTIHMTFRAWFDSDKPWRPLVSLGATGKRHLTGAAKSGAETTLSVTLDVPTAGRHELFVRWPLPASIVHLYGVNVVAR